ncbi:MAG: elongation factor 1-beta [Candidatus Aenigmatarchaeota archaeon]|nr:elongation factor 1-beta [Candidatus Aenigmarchaeota archaeon]
MGQVAVLFKILPESPETNLNEIKDEIKKIIEIKDYRIEPLAFGLNQLKILVIVDDKKGLGDLETKIKNVHGVADAEIESTTLI